MARLTQYIRQLRENGKLLKRIMDIGPDEPLGEMSEFVPRLERAGLLKVIEHSDGDYVAPTKRGRKILEMMDA